MHPHSPEHGELHPHHERDSTSTINASAQQQQPDAAADPSSSGRLGMSAATKDFIGGAVAGALAIVTTQPLDILRVRLQHSFSGYYTGGAAMAVAAQPPATGSNSSRRALPGSEGAVYARQPPPKPMGTLASLRYMVRTEGLMSPFKGMGMPLTFSSMQNAIIFNVYGVMLRAQQERQEQQQQQHGSGSLQSGQSAAQSTLIPSDSQGERAFIPTPWQGFVAGCVAGLMQVFAWSPIEVVKLRIQLQTASQGQPGYMGPSAVVRNILRTDSIPGLYRGFTITVLRDIPSYGVYFSVYHYLTALMEGPDVHPEDARPLTNIVAGGLSGCAAWTSIYYLDVIKCRMQATTRSKDTGATWLTYARQVYKQGGVPAFFRGFQLTLTRAFIMDAASFLGYNYSLRALQDL